MSQPITESSRGEIPLHSAQPCLYHGYGPPPHGVFPDGEDASSSSSALSPATGHYMAFFDIDGTSMISPAANATSSPMAGSFNSEYPYDPHLFAVGPQVEYSDPRAIREDESPDNPFELYPGASWSHWPPVPVRTMDEAAEAPQYHTPPQFPPHSVPMVSGMTNFEPMMTTYETHGAVSTRETPRSPSPTSSGSAAVFSRKNSYQKIVHSPATSAVQPSTPLEFRFERMSPAAWKPSAARQVAEQLPGNKERNSAANTRATGSRAAATTTTMTATATATTTMTTTTTTTPEVRSDTPAHATASPAAHDQSTEASAAGPGTTDDAAAAAAAAAGARAGDDPQRQRNRAAATKCRRKSKVAVAQLEATERALGERHAELAATVAGLRGEVLALKNEILLHGNCDCDMIRRYLTDAARSLRGTIMAGAGPGAAHDGAAWVPPPAVAAAAAAAVSPTPPGPGGQAAADPSTGCSPSMT